MKRAMADDDDHEDARKRIGYTTDAGLAGLNRDVWSIIMQILRRTVDHRPLSITCRQLYDIARLQTRYFRLLQVPPRNPCALTLLPRPALMRYAIVTNCSAAAIPFFNRTVSTRQQSRPGFILEYTSGLLASAGHEEMLSFQNVSVIATRGLAFLMLAISATRHFPGPRWPCFRCEGTPGDAVIGPAMAEFMRTRQVRYLLLGAETEPPAGWPSETVTLAELRAEVDEAKVVNKLN